MQHKQNDRSPTASHKLFVDYPYPMINELNKTYKHHKSSDHLHDLVSLQWYKNGFHRMCGLLHNIRIHISPTSIVEQSFKQAHIDEHSSKAVVDNLKKQSKPTRIRRVLASSVRRPMDEEENGEEKEQNVQKIIANVNHCIDDDRY